MHVGVVSLHQCRSAIKPPLRARAWQGVAGRGRAWRGVAWRGVAWRGVAAFANISRHQQPSRGYREGERDGMAPDPAMSTGLGGPRWIRVSTGGHSWRLPAIPPSTHHPQTIVMLLPAGVSGIPMHTQLRDHLPHEHELPHVWHSCSKRTCVRSAVIGHLVIAWLKYRSCRV